MKKITLLACFLIATLASKSQVMYPYTFTPLTESYTNLVGAANLTIGNAWDDTTMTVPLGFTFKWALANRNIDSIVIDTDGILYAPQDYVQAVLNPIRSMMAYQADMVDRGYNNSSAPVSPVSFVKTGAVGSRICKIEFKNAGFYSDNSSMDFANFQVWLYETSNIIEYRYGSSSVSNVQISFDGRNGPYINLLYKTTINVANQTIILDSCTYISGNAATVAAINPSTPIDYLNQPPANFAFSGLPSNGQVFRFAPIGVNASVSAIEKAFADVVVYPTYIQDAVKVAHNGKQLSARITNLNGQVILEEKNILSNTKLNTSMLSQGIYFFTLTDQQSLSKTYKLVK